MDDNEIKEIEFDVIPPTWEKEDIEPPTQLREEGFKAGYKPPAAYFNWFFNLTYKCLKEIQEKVIEAISDIKEKVAALRQQTNEKIEEIKTRHQEEMQTLSEKQEQDIQTITQTHQNDILLITSEHNKDIQAINNEMIIVKKSVSDGKTLVAAAITRKRVETAATATYQQMADNIDLIALGWGNAAEWQVLDGVVFSNADGVKRTGTMPNISAFDSLKSMVESQGTLYCRMSYGAHITNASSGYPELMIGMTSFGSASADKVLKNQTFTSSNGLKITGTMPDNSGVNTNGTVPGVSTSTPSDPTRQAPTTLLCPDTAGTKRFNFRIPEGYYGRNGWVNIPASNLGDAATNHVLKGKTFTSSNGVKITGTIPIEKIEGVIVLSADAKNNYYFTIKDAYYQGGGSLKIPSLLDQTMATAIASHILSGKTAWVDGEKITGTMTNRAAYTNALSVVKNGDNNNLHARIPTGAYLTKIAASDAPEIVLPAANVRTAIGLTADKIKKGETILGVAGTAEGETNLYILKDGVFVSPSYAGAEFKVPSNVESGDIYYDSSQKAMIVKCRSFYVNRVTNVTYDKYKYMSTRAYISKRSSNSTLYFGTQSSGKDAATVLVFSLSDNREVSNSDVIMTISLKYISYDDNMAQPIFSVGGTAPSNGYENKIYDIWFHN